ncbi:MAG: hypothetical protein RMY36_027995 [Nostoc sp. SerVER01]|nr:hypothetical protein [Nostoc sp. SerVER01]MDZ8027649.1 hypothetical protein [Nostoc sp. DedQUE11]MDZ8073363.1 hypothetical protein [Nostoc sp. DedQUE01]
MQLQSRLAYDRTKIQPPSTNVDLELMKERRELSFCLSPWYSSSSLNRYLAD